MKPASWIFAGVLCGVLFAIVAPSGCGIGGLGGDCTGAEGPLPRDGVYVAASNCAPGFACSTSEAIRVSEAGASMVYSYSRQGKHVTIEYRHLRGVVTDLGAGDH